jgi:hypothetical protein
MSNKSERSHSSHLSAEESPSYRETVAEETYRTKFGMVRRNTELFT